jgi:hypothetical protein
MVDAQHLQVPVFICVTALITTHFEVRELKDEEFDLPKVIQSIAEPRIFSKKKKRLKM